MKPISLDKLIFYLISGGFLMPILPNFIRNILLGAVFFTILINFITSKSDRKIDYRLLIIGPLLYVTYLVSLLYTENLGLGLKKLETGVSLFIIPVMLSFLPKKTKFLLLDNIAIMLRCFIISTAISFVAFFLFFWNQYEMSLLQHYPTLINNNLGPYHIHPIYISMHGAIALLFALYLFSKKRMKPFTFLVTIISVIVILAFLLLLIKKGPILSLLIAGSYMAFAYKNKFIISGIVIFGVVLIGLVAFNDDANSRFSELLRIGDSNDKELTSTDIRLIIYSCAKKAIPGAGILGYGVGDAKSILIDCYQSKNQDLVDNEYNSHNQYLSIILRSGFLGLACFASFLIYIIMIMHKRKSYITVAIIVFYLLVMFSENILERENGVVYFCFFTVSLYTIFKTPKVDINSSNEKAKIL